MFVGPYYGTLIEGAIGLANIAQGNTKPVEKLGKRFTVGKIPFIEQAIEEGGGNTMSRPKRSSRSRRSSR